MTATATGHAVTTRGDRGEGIPTELWARVVAGSGTGDLAGLTGTGLVEHELVTLQVELRRAPALTGPAQSLNCLAFSATWSTTVSMLSGVRSLIAPAT